MRTTLVIVGLLLATASSALASDRIAVSDARDACRPA
jgi:hypothetical protein